MNDGFVTKAVAVRMKELGFDQKTWLFYQDGNAEIMCSARHMDYNEFTDCQSAPTWTEAACWSAKKLTEDGYEKIPFVFPTKKMEEEMLRVLISIKK